MLKIGLTGNIGCGKSTVSIELEKLGYPVIDADKISREIYTYPDIIRKIEENFSEAVLDGNVIREELGKIVFSDKRKLELLNKLTHEKINSIIEECIKKHLDSGDVEATVVDAALMYETDFDKAMDKVVVIYCDPEVQVERVINRDGLSEFDVKKRIASQMDQNKKVEMADFVIDNSKDFPCLEKNISQLDLQIKKWIEEEGCKLEEEKG